MNKQLVRVIQYAEGTHSKSSDRTFHAFLNISPLCAATARATRSCETFVRGMVKNGNKPYVNDQVVREVHLML